MNMYSLFKKAITLTKINLFSSNRLIEKNLYLQNISVDNLNQVRKILFFFDNSSYMHLGDHLFFIPLIQSFVESTFDVEVMPTKAMVPLFKQLGFTLVTDSINFRGYDLIISRIEMIEQLRKYPILLTNVSSNLTMPICDQLIHNFGKFFHLMPFNKINYTQFKNDSIINTLDLPTNKKLILFNLYCDSSAYLITKHKLRILLKLVKEYASKPDYQVVLVGTDTDKKKYQLRLDFPFIDIRGRTSVLDIFALVNNSNVSYYIGFDAFVMHVFSLLHKQSFVVFRGRFRKQQHQMLKKYHVNLFKYDKFVILLNELSYEKN